MGRFFFLGGGGQIGLPLEKLKLNSELKLKPKSQSEDAKIEGRRQRGRPRRKYIDGLLQTTGTTQANLIRRARKRKDWRSMVANVQVDTAPR